MRREEKEKREKGRELRGEECNAHVG